MADLTDYLPFFGSKPIFGPSSADVAASILPGGDTATTADSNNPFTPPPEHLTIGGVPLQSLIGGGLGGLIAASMARKRFRGRAFGQGFGLGEQLFQAPITEEKRRNDALMQAAINKGWIQPVDSTAPFITKPMATPTGPTGTLGGVPSKDLLAPTAAAAGGATPGVDPTLLALLNNAPNMSTAPATDPDLAALTSAAPDLASSGAAAAETTPAVDTATPATAATATPATATTTPSLPVSYTALAPVPSTPAATPTSAATTARPSTIKWGGMQFTVAPRVRLGDLYPGQDLPPSLANATIPATAEAAEAARAGIEHAKWMKYIAAQPWYTPGMPEETAIARAKFEQQMRQLAALKQSQGPLAPGERVDYTVGKEGITAKSSQISQQEADFKIKTLELQRQNAINEGDAHKIQLKDAEIRLELTKQLPTKERVADLRTTATALGANLRDLTDQERALSTSIKLGQKSPEDVARLRTIQSQRDETQALYTNVTRKLAELGDVSMEGVKPQKTPAETAHDASYLRYFASIQNLDNPLSATRPDDPVEGPIWDKAMESYRHEIQPMLNDLDRHMQSHPHASGPDAQWTAQWRNYLSQEPGLYESALRVWKAQHHSGYLFNLPGTSTSPTTATTSPLGNWPAT